MSPQRKRPGIGDAVTTWLVLYPSILLVSWVTGPITQEWVLPLRLLFTTVIVVPLMTFVLMPLAMGLRESRRVRAAQARALDPS